MEGSAALFMPLPRSLPAWERYFAIFAINMARLIALQRHIVDGMTLRISHSSFC
jgi:hypothetical protein